MGHSFTLRSPAKLNLYLRVLNKRPDGFHNIETLFERISLFDTMHFSSHSSGKIQIFCDHPHVPIGPKNLVYKVAQRLQKEYFVKEGVKIVIKKRIPVAAGLAGGSSNAATALLGLNQLWGLSLNQKQLLSHAACIGSDVSFFLHDCSWGLGTGRGEHIKKIDLSVKLWHVLVVPRVKVYSGKVYEKLSSESMNILTKKQGGANILIRSLKNHKFSEIGRRLTNDLEKSVMFFCPTLNRLKQRLERVGTYGVLVSGSGPSVFGMTANKEEATAVQQILARRFSQVFVVATQ